jgi:xanthine dehydrogenase YagS FAD-binding subunit
VNSFEWSDAGSLADALVQLRAPRTVVKAGGVDLLDRLKEGLDEPARIVNLRTIPNLDYLRDDGKNGLALGPLVTLARLAADPLVRSRYPALAEAAAHTATPQVRNMATLGGNLLQRPRCWYFRSLDHPCRKKGGAICFALDGENQFHAVFGNQLCAAPAPSTPATALVALDARVVVRGEKGERELALEQLFTAPEVDVRRETSLAPDELIVEVRLPALAAGTRSAFIKQGARESFDWPIADVAVVLDLNGRQCRRASIVLGAAAPIPWRAKLAEVVLAGQAITPETAAAAGGAAIHGATPLDKNRYKLQVIKTVVARAVLAAAGGAA